MPKTLMQSVVSQLQKERTRLEDELHRVTAAAASELPAGALAGCRSSWGGAWVSGLKDQTLTYPNSCVPLSFQHAPILIGQRGSVQ